MLTQSQSPFGLQRTPSRQINTMNRQSASLTRSFRPYSTKTDEIITDLETQHTQQISQPKSETLQNNTHDSQCQTQILKMQQQIVDLQLQQKDQKQLFEIIDNQNEGVKTLLQVVQQQNIMQQKQIQELQQQLKNQKQYLDQFIELSTQLMSKPKDQMSSLQQLFQNFTKQIEIPYLEVNYEDVSKQIANSATSLIQSQLNNNLNKFTQNISEFVQLQLQDIIKEAGNPKSTGQNLVVASFQEYLQQLTFDVQQKINELSNKLFKNQETQENNLKAQITASQSKKLQTVDQLLSFQQKILQQKKDFLDEAEVLRCNQIVLQQKQIVEQQVISLTDKYLQKIKYQNQLNKTIKKTHSLNNITFVFFFMNINENKDQVLQLLSFLEPTFDVILENGNNQCAAFQLLNNKAQPLNNLKNTNVFYNKFIQIRQNFQLTDFQNLEGFQLSNQILIQKCIEIAKQTKKQQICCILFNGSDYSNFDSEQQHLNSVASLPVLLQTINFSQQQIALKLQTSQFGRKFKNYNNIQLLSENDYCQLMFMERFFERLYLLQDDWKRLKLIE